MRRAHPPGGRTGKAASVFHLLDATNRRPRNRSAHRGARNDRGGRRGARQAAVAPDARLRRLFGRLRGQSQPGRDRLPLAPEPVARPRLEHQALHHRGRPGPLRERGHARHGGARGRRTGRRRGLAGRPVPARRRRSDLRQHQIHDQELWRGGHGRAAGGAPQRGGCRARDRPDLRGRVALRRAARRPRVPLRNLDLGRPAERPVLQPRARQRERRVLPAQSSRVRGRPPGCRARGARRAGAAEAARGRHPSRDRGPRQRRLADDVPPHPADKQAL